MKNRKLARLVNVFFIIIMLVVMPVFMFVYTWDAPGKASNYMVMYVPFLIPGLIAMIVSVLDLFKKPISYLSWFVFFTAIIICFLLAYHIYLVI